MNSTLALLKLQNATTVLTAIRAANTYGTNGLLVGGFIMMAFMAGLVLMWRYDIQERLAVLGYIFFIVSAFMQLAQLIPSQITLFFALMAAIGTIWIYVANKS